MKVFFQVVPTLALLVSAAAASIVPRQNLNERFFITAVGSGISDVNGKNAFAATNGLVYLGPAPDKGAVEPIVAQYFPDERIIKNAVDTNQELWVVLGGKGEVFMQQGAPPGDSEDRPFLIEPNDEIIFDFFSFPDSWTACPTDTPAIYQLFFKNFDGMGCAAVKLVKSHTVPTVNP